MFAWFLWRVDISRKAVNCSTLSRVSLLPQEFKNKSYYAPPNAAYLCCLLLLWSFLLLFFFFFFLYEPTYNPLCATPGCPFVRRPPVSLSHSSRLAWKMIFLRASFCVLCWHHRRPAHNRRRSITSKPICLFDCARVCVLTVAAHVIAISHQPPPPLRSHYDKSFKFLFHFSFKSHRCLLLLLL